MRFPAGRVIFREHDPGGALFTITAGRVELFVVQDDAARLVVDVLQPGEFFGEMSLLDGGGRSTSALALEEVSIRSELDYQVNVKAELEILQLHDKVDVLEAKLLSHLAAGGGPERDPQAPDRPPSLSS